MASEARAKAKMYAEVEKQLEEKINQIQSSLNFVKETLEEADNTFVNGNGEAEGKILTTFTHKESLWQIRYKGMLMNIEEGLECLRLRKIQARIYKETYEAKAEIEEMKANGGF